ncbi:hypothetical protein B5807_03555 [Epicoccum nigrum]|uniref:Invertebrate defensins family profile domain-containing protein n=1 Tax=Epicoccum nigrum TaxID=105696 RepID=A0A1Y2M7T5_EPING|nr:hypothetical protein B5807_03555 [Epicoccum nigrum]
MRLTTALLATLTLAPVAFSLPLTTSVNNNDTAAVVPASTNITTVLQTHEVGCPFSENKCRKKCHKKGWKTGSCGGFL